jgi:hypothetical protein
MTDFQKTARELVIKLHNCNEATLDHPGYQWEVQVLIAALKAAFDAGRESAATIADAHLQYQTYDNFKGIVGCGCGPQIAKHIRDTPTPPATVKEERIQDLNSIQNVNTPARPDEDEVERMADEESGIFCLEEDGRGINVKDHTWWYLHEDGFKRGYRAAHAKAEAQIRDEEEFLCSACKSPSRYIKAGDFRTCSTCGAVYAPGPGGCP